MPTLPYMTADSYFGLAVESTYGTPVPVTLMTPVSDPKVTPGVKWLDDSDFRGSPVMHYDQVQGVFHATYDAKTFTYTDVYPALLRAALGSVDTVGASVAVTNVSGASAVGYPHTIGLINTPNQGSQPPSYTIINDSVDNTYQLAASKLSTMGLTFQADAAVENTFQFLTNAASVVASVSAASVSTQHLIPAWNCAASIGGVAVSVVESLSLDIKRNTAQIYTLGSQSAVSNFAGPLEVSGKCSFIAQTSQNFWANALIRDQQQVLLNLIDPATGYGILFQMSAVQLENPVINQGKTYVGIDFDLFAVANTTDALALYNTAPNGGYSPIKTISTIASNVAF